MKTKTIKKKVSHAVMVSMGLTGFALAGTPFQGQVAQLPGTVQAENFDVNGYYDTSTRNIGGQYRDEQVDIERSQIGDYNVGWFEPGEWLTYTVNVAHPGDYLLDARTASPSGGRIQFQISGSTSLTAPEITVGDTGGWQNWSSTDPVSIALNAGSHTIRVTQRAGAYNLDSFRITPTSGSDNPTAYPGYTGVYPGFSLVLDERFNTFNTSVWAKGDGAVGAESMCRFTDNGVNVVDGNLELTVRSEYVPASWSQDHQSWKGAYSFSCGELRTVPEKRIRYGRIETRMRAPNRNVASGYISSLFTYRNEGNPREWEEIDIELEGGRPDKFQANLIYGNNAQDWNATRQWGAWEHKIDVGAVDQWRVFAIEWTPDQIRWFVDGNLVKTLKQSDINCSKGCVWPQIHATPIPDDLTELMMNFWIPNDSIQDVFGGNKWANVYPMTTQYDWVRIYELDSHPLQNW
ncbi:family 16 glycosylhydrolase [Reinekea sp. G2M2-21]|uniref:family 16 glycosylhydrolase n=1 Tax=Reinekea sp. G2M2-21 TaxID=2788942 RepID=UPI001E3B43CB|nr:family 16 glycosylhydrolase [Reinekea sp. G2M2-21]